MVEENDYSRQKTLAERVKKMEAKIIQLEYRIEALEEDNLEQPNTCMMTPIGGGNDG